MKLAGPLAAALVAAACAGPSAAPGASGSPLAASPAGTIIVGGAHAYACRDANGPGGGLLLDHDYVGEAVVLDILGPNDLTVKTTIPLNIAVHATSDTKFTPSTVTTLKDLGLESGKTKILITVCAKAYDPARTVGAFKGFYSVAEVSKE